MEKPRVASTSTLRELTVAQIQNSILAAGTIVLCRFIGTSHELAFLCATAVLAGFTIAETLRDSLNLRKYSWVGNIIASAITVALLVHQPTIVQNAGWFFIFISMNFLLDATRYRRIPAPFLYTIPIMMMQVLAITLTNDILIHTHK